MFVHDISCPPKTQSQCPTVKTPKPCVSLLFIFKKSNKCSEPVTLMPLPTAVLRSDPRVITSFDGGISPLLQILFDAFDFLFQPLVPAHLGDIDFCELVESAILHRLVYEFFLVVPVLELELVTKLREAQVRPRLVILFIFKAHAEAVTHANVLDGTVHVGAGEDVLPNVLPHAARKRVVQRRAEEPVAVGHEPLQRNGADAVAAEGELRAARLGQHLGNGVQGEQLAPSLGQKLLFMLLDVILYFSGVPVLL